MYCPNVSPKYQRIATKIDSIIAALSTHREKEICSTIAQYCLAFVSGIGSILVDGKKLPSSVIFVIYDLNYSIKCIIQNGGRN